MLNHIRKAVEPGVATQVNRLIDASSGKITESGRTRDFTTEVMAQLMGARTQSVDVPTALGFRARNIDVGLGQAQSIINRSLSAFANNATDATVEATVQSYSQSNQARLRIFREAKRLVDDATQLGLKPSQIGSILKQRGMSKKDINAILRNRFIPSQPSKEILKRASRNDSYPAVRAGMRQVFLDMFNQPLSVEAQ